MKYKKDQIYTFDVAGFISTTSGKRCIKIMDDNASYFVDANDSQKIESNLPDKLRCKVVDILSNGRPLFEQIEEVKNKKTSIVTGPHVTDYEKGCSWKFVQQTDGMLDIGPNDSMSQNFKQHPYTSLVRESIQNSLDAVADKTLPVRVSFSFNLIYKRRFKYFFELKNHIQGCLHYYNGNRNAEEIYEPMLDLFSNNTHIDIGYIKVSDYNTRGMDYAKGNTKSPFYAFVMSAGVSSKQNESSGGSFGFGKAAYFQMSPLKSVLVSTMTIDRDCYFQGVSSLCTHTYKNYGKVAAVGFYDNNGGLPVSENDKIPVEFRRTEPGTDICIMGFDISNKEDCINEMIEAVLRNFWLAIYERELEVVIDNDTIINSDTLEKFMLKYFEEETDTHNMLLHNPRPYYEAVKFADTDKKHKLYDKDIPFLGKCKFYSYKDEGCSK
jgi:hypothetical protein